MEEDIKPLVTVSSNSLPQANCPAQEAVSPEPTREPTASAIPNKPTPKNSGTKGKGCYIAVIVFLVLIILFLIGSAVVLTVLAVSLCGDDPIPEDKSEASKYKLYMIDKKMSDVNDNLKENTNKKFAEASSLSSLSQKDGTIFMLPIYGTIVSGNWTGSSQDGFVTAEEITYALKYIAKQKNVKAIILDINSPGGSVTASDNIYHEVKQFKKDNHIPVVTMFEGIACSGGYYSAMASDYIIALPTTWTGSIGVIMEVPEISSLMGKVGVNVNTITSLNANGGASFKDIGSSYRKMRPEERQLLQTLVTQSWNRFVDVVADGRKGKLNKDQIKKLADGRIYSSEQALKHKLIDQIGYRQDLYKKTRELAKAPNAPIVCLAFKGSLWDSLGSAASQLRNLAEFKAAPWQLMKNTSMSAYTYNFTNSASPAPMYKLPSDAVQQY
ncbi:MAG: signal peptide peptidase SppA [Candidatus Bruticola sp.]